MFINDLLINSLLRYLNSFEDKLDKENFYLNLLEANEQNSSLETLKFLGKEFLMENIYNLFFANMDKFQVLKSNYNSNFNSSNELVDYRINIQNTLCHQNMGNLQDNYSIILQLIFKNERKKIFEIDQSDIGKFIERLQEIYGKIRN